MKRALVSIVLCALIVGLGVGVTTVASKFRGNPQGAQAAVPEGGAKVTSVNVQILKPTRVDDRLILTGTADPWEDIVVSAEGHGRIEWQGVKEGDVVRKGQELVRIDTSLAQAQLAQAQAQHKLALQERERVEKLSLKGIATDQARDKTQADHDMASASLRLVQVQLDKSAVSAPIDGIVDKLFKDENEFIDVGAPLVRLVQVHKIKVRVGIPERDVSCFAKGGAVTVRFDALPEREFAGTIHRIAATAEPATLTFITEVELDNPEGLIRPGMVARATLVRRSYPDSIAIPIYAILSLQSQRFAVVEENGIARMRPIEVGVIQGNTVQVTKGLAAGSRLIVAGQRDLQDGDPVKVLEVVE